MGGLSQSRTGASRLPRKIDHRSYADQNNGLQATIHEGTSVTQLRRQGIDTEISRYNDHVKQHNAQHLKQQQQRTDSVFTARFKPCRARLRAMAEKPRS